MTDEDRDRGRTEAKVDRLEDEVDKLRDKSHKQAGEIQAATNWVAVFRELKIDDRLKSLEGWRQWVLGAAAAVGAVAGILGSWAAKHLP